MCKLVEDYAEDRIKESQKETARRMFEKGVAMDIIKLATSALTDEELEAIANEMIKI